MVDQKSEKIGDLYSTKSKPEKRKFVGRESLARVPESCFPEILQDMTRHSEGLTKNTKEIIRIY
jgi:hypothetical protein